MPANRRILLAVDGSEQSFTAVRYINRVLSKQTEVVLFHVEAEVPEAFRDLGVDPETGEQMYPLQIWRVHQREFTNEFIDKAHKMVLDAGFPKVAVSIKTQSLESGIARDIINESYHDYSALVMGRSGVSRIDDMMIGSIASKLLEVIAHLPIVIVGDKAESNKIMIAFDGSEGSKKAARCVGSLLDPAVCELLLCHVIRPLSTQQLGAKELFIAEHEKQWIETHQRTIIPAIAAAKKHLVEAGFAEDRISSAILTHETSRAAAVVKAARANGCGTIVLGRRGLTSVGEFKIGRVSRKILHLAYQPALWIVN